MPTPAPPPAPPTVPALLGPLPRPLAPASMLLRNGRVIDPATGLDEVADVAIVDGKVAAIGRSLSGLPAAAVIDAEACIVAPGLVDPHVHLREPGQEQKETIATGSASAARGGFTTVVAMPNTAPATDAPEVVRAVQHIAAARARCRVYTTAAATIGRKGVRLTDIDGLARAGAVGFTDDGDVVESPAMMLRVMQAVRETGRVFMQHCQDVSLTQGASMHQGEVSLQHGLIGWPRIAEDIIVERDVRLARETQCRYHVQHISSSGAVEIVRRARKASPQGAPDLVTAEASPHHLTLTHAACDGFNTLAKMNPPLREQSDIAAIRQAVADGVITVLATDHAPHKADEKALDFESAPFGIVGLETALPLYREALVETGAIGWPKLIELLTAGPARLCGLDRVGLGALKVGGPADITIIDPAAAWTVDPADFVSKGQNTPFAGRAMQGRAVRTIVGGATAWSLEAKTARG